jgi:two-component system NtrC family sensor kinase
VNIERQYAEQLPDIQGNFANLGQVFINVIKNAIQSLPEGKGKIILKTSHDQRADRVIITCGDTGRGIPMDQIKDIFKPFFTTKTVGQGTGLGLYISHEIIKKHGGSIHVRSDVGQGTVFTIELPCKRSAA